jgi:hypothetical protein
MTTRLLILGSLLLSLSLSAFAAVSSFGPEVPISPATIVRSVTLQESPAIATNGDGFLAAWFDSRDQQGTYATRVDSSGHVVDQPSFLIALEQGPIAATGAGRDTLVAVAPCGAIDVFRIDENRNVSAPAHIATTANLCWGSVSVATNGSSVVVAFAGRVIVLDENLSLTKQFTIDSSASYAAVASNGNDYVVVTAAQSPVALSTHLDASGTIVSSHQIFFPNNLNSLAIASNGDDYLALGGGPILGAERIDANGSPADVGKMVHVASSPRPITLPSIVWDGNEYIATYVQAPFISTPQSSAIVRVNANADVLSEQPIGTSREANVAVRAGRAAVVSNDGHTAVQIFSTDNLTALTLPAAISTSAIPQFTPKAVDANGTVTIFWRERGESSQPLKAKTAGGNEVTLIDSISSDYSAGFDGTRYVVVWQSANVINVQRFEPNLTPFDPNPVSINPINPILRPVAAIANGRVLIAWPEVNGNLLSTKAMVLDTTAGTITFPQPAILSSPPFDNGVPAVAWDGSAFAVVWPHALGTFFDGLFNPPDEVLARHVSRDGAVLDDAFVVARPNAHVTWLGAAGDFAAWATGTMVYGKLIRATGDAMVIGPNTPNGGVSVATYRGGYVVAWPAPGSSFSTYSPALRLVDANGTPWTMYALSEVPHSFLTDDVDFESGLLIYMRTATEPEYGGVSRLFTRTFDAVPPRRHGAAR